MPAFIFQLNFQGEHYFENILNIEKYDADRNFAKLRKPVEKDK
jgi:predicted metalloendopeptidase